MMAKQHTKQELYEVAEILGACEVLAGHVGNWSVAFVDGGCTVVCDLTFPGLRGQMAYWSPRIKANSKTWTCPFNEGRMERADLDFFHPTKEPRTLLQAIFEDCNAMQEEMRRRREEYMQDEN